MKIVSFLAVAAVLGATGLAAAPAFAAPQTVAGNVPFCSTGNTTDYGQQKQELSNQLQLSTKLSSNIGVWNGCLKVTTTDSSGHSNIAFYDPDSLRLISQMS